MILTIPLLTLIVAVAAYESPYTRFRFKRDKPRLIQPPPTTNEAKNPDGEQVKVDTLATVEMNSIATAKFYSSFANKTREAGRIALENAKETIEDNKESAQNTLIMVGETAEFIQ